MDNGSMPVEYSGEYERAWDRFVLNESMNGTFLQTRNFLNYHPGGRFRDNSLLFVKGDTIAAVIPANAENEGGRKRLISHRGSTFGGIVLGERHKRLSEVQALFQALDAYLRQKGFSEITLRQTSRIFSKDESEILDYFLFQNGYLPSCEIGYYIDFETYGEDIPGNFTASKRRDYRYSLRHPLEFRQIVSDGETAEFYRVLSENMKKFDTLPLHTLEELLEFKNKRLPSQTRFYGVFSEERLVAGGMVFLFGRRVFHTQYLAARQDMLEYYPNEFLYKSLIETARQEGFEKLSFGTSTLEHGRVLNRSLAQFKEGFGTREYVNRTFTKRLQEG